MIACEFLKESQRTATFISAEINDVLHYYAKYSGKNIDTDGFLTLVTNIFQICAILLVSQGGSWAGQAQNPAFSTSL